MMIISALTPPPLRPGLLLSSDPCAPSASLSHSSNDIGHDGAAALSTSLAGLTSMQTLNIRCGRPSPPSPPPPAIIRVRAFVRVRAFLRVRARPKCESVHEKLQVLGAWHSPSRVND
jgi:hypothetical protein